MVALVEAALEQIVQARPGLLQAREPGGLIGAGEVRLGLFGERKEGFAVAHGITSRGLSWHRRPACGPRHRRAACATTRQAALIGQGVRESLLQAGEAVAYPAVRAQ